MDYDDNDFQSQNLHLTGDNNNKYPPVSQPYALPKFDFVDSLNGHLRFDSLVETEVFLGIEGNEDNNWIEDFSPGSSGVVFSSSAAESCAISRHNNVWSEATSTESVEMLLKSVGQDEIIAREDIIKKSDTCDELGCITEQMEPSETCGEKILSKDETVNLHPNASSDETPGESSVSLEDAGLEQTLVKDNLPTVAHELSVEGGNIILPSKTGTVEVSVTVSSQDDPGYAKQMFVEQGKIESETAEYILDKMEHEVSSDSVMEINHADGSVHNISTSIAELNSQKTLLVKNLDDKVNISDSMQSSDCNCEDLNRDEKSVLVEAHLDSDAVLPSKCENEEAENVGYLTNPDLRPTELSDFPMMERGSQSSVDLEAGGQEVSGLINDSEAQCQNVHVGNALASTTIETSVDLVGQNAKSIPDHEKPELLIHNNLETIASESESSLRTEISEQTHLVEASEAVHDSPVDSMEESSKIVRVDESSYKSSDYEGSVQGPPSSEKRKDLAFDAHDASNSQIVSERTSFESFGNISGASASKLTELKSQSDTLPGTVVDGQECQALSHNIDELKQLNNDKTPATSAATSADLSIPETSSDVTEKGSVSEPEKVSSCEPDNGPPAGACGSGSEMDNQACKHNEDTKAATYDVEDCPVNDGSKDEKAQDTAQQTMLQKYEKTILEENLDAELKSISGTELNPNKDGINAQPDASSLENLGAEVRKDDQEDNKNIESIDTIKAGTPILRTQESCVTGMEEAVTEPGNPSTSPIGDKPSMPAGSQVLKRNNTSCGQTSITCDTTSLADSSVKQVGEVSHPINSSEAILVSPVVVGSPVTPSLEKTIVRTSKGASERKSRRMSKSTGKETSRKGNVVKETTPSRQLQSGAKTSVFYQNTPSTGQITQSTEKQPHPHAETFAVKPFGNFSMPMSSLPDLNSSALSLLQRPFTDMQQVQLRAQIFVYGALIQGTAPDEAYMISAFGGPDGGKGIWEKPWRACVERIQKSHAATPETPLLSRAGKIATPSVGHTSSKEIPAVNPIIPVSSPLWSLPTPRDALQSSSMQRGLATDHQPLLSSLHAHQTPPIKNIVGHNAPWISPTPYRSPWLASPQTSAFDVGTRFSVFPITEAVKLTPMKETSLSHSAAKHLQKDSVQSGMSSGVVRGTPFHEPKSVVVAPSQHSTEATPTPRKRKKIPVSEEPGSSILNSQKQTESIVSPLVIPASAAFTPTPASVVSSASVPTFSLGKPSSSLPFPILSGNLVSGNLEMKQRPVLSEDAVGTLKEATRHAEDASALAAAAVSHSQYVWKQVYQHKNAGLEAENQGKLASAAVAIAAAAAVAKAAAAAANVAASAALQAKLMAEEASILNSSDHGNELSKLEGNQIGQATPSSILKGNGAMISSSSVLTAAREAAKKRVEAATAATKRAENMDAIVKAAELSAEAVSQAGKLVSLGDPLSLNELVKTGPDGYWRHALVSQESEPCQRGAMEKRETLALQMHTDGCTGLDDPLKSGDGVSCALSAAGKKTKGHKGADLTKNDVLEPEAAPMSSADIQSKSGQIVETANENGLKEGSRVEVLKEGPGLRTGWYSANVLSLKDGKAYVCYTELSTGEGTDKLIEWVALEGDGDVAPKIRTARSVNAMPFEGTRKRRRAATGDHTWSIGDKVDAWVHDSWWEGIISEKNKKDETTLTVHFPVQGETLMVKSWNLRPSLVWKDGRWIECSSSGASISSLHEGDTPNEKRPRLKSPVQEAVVKDTTAKHVDGLDLGKLPQTGLLQLDISEKTFNIGRSSRNENKPDPLRMKRTGLQKQGSRVIFGVPKPGKKRKFMEVSKHYVSEPAGKTRLQNEPPKSVKPIAPQSSGSRAWRNASKIDPRERQSAVSKPKIFKPASKSKEKPGGAAKNIAQKEDSQSISAHNLGTDGAADQRAEHKGSVSGILSNIQSGGTIEEQTTSSSHDTSKKPSSSMKGERMNKGKLGKIEEDKVLGENSSKTSDSIERRRSNRRIQPTSRLLEGLQTSMITSKIPSVTHGKGQQNQSKSSTRGGK